MSFYSNLFVKHIKNIKNIKYIRYSHNYKLLDGKFVSNIILNNIKNNIETNNYKISLNSVVVGENPDSLKYINIKNKVCNQLNIKNNVLHFNKSIYNTRTFTPSISLLKCRIYWNFRGRFSCTPEVF